MVRNVAATQLPEGPILKFDYVIIGAGDVIFVGATPAGKVTTGAQSPYQKCGIGYVRFDSPGEWSGKTLDLISSRTGKISCEIVDLPFFDRDKRLPRGLPLKGELNKHNSNSRMNAGNSQRSEHLS
jgi:glycine cleavage system aminomethyltransferase T